jgi:hypothetical protein
MMLRFAVDDLIDASRGDAYIATYSVWLSSKGFMNSSSNISPG